MLSSQFHRFTLISVNGSIISNYNDIQMLQHAKDGYIINNFSLKATYFKVNTQNKETAINIKEICNILVKIRVKM